MTSETKVRVRYAETDQMGVVYHANYLIWFEVGRVEHIRSMGLNYKSMEQQDGCGIAVVEASARYKAPARYDDELLIRTRIAQIRGSVIRFAYLIYRASPEGAEHQLLCEGSTTHVVVDRNMKKTAMPPRFAEAFRAHHIAIAE
jgi:acyl-CoA thioester hydrolase